MVGDGGHTYFLTKNLKEGEELRWNYGNYNDTEEKVIAQITEWAKIQVSMTFLSIILTLYFPTYRYPKLF